MTGNSPKVSIWCITYNHEQYISEALDGILMQKTNFDYEIVVGEDKSRDNTRSMLLAYKEKHPDKIKLLLHDENIGMTANVIATLEACTGEYIALCEGDDYWTDPLKLQKQVDFLDDNKDYSLCFHDVIKRNDENGRQVVTSYSNNISSVDIKDLALDSSYIFTPSVVFRSFDFKCLINDQFKESKVCDYFIFMYALRYGKGYMMKEVMSVYREASSSSVWSKNSTTKRIDDTISVLLLLKIEFENDVNIVFNLDKQIVFYLNKLLELKEESCTTLTKYYELLKVDRKLDVLFLESLRQNKIELRTLKIKQSSILFNAKSLVGLVFKRLIFFKRL